MPHAKSNGSHYALIACDVFQEELTALGGATPPWHSIEYLEMGLHDQPDELRRQIQALITRVEADPAVATIVLAYGLCGNGLLGIEAGRCPIILPRAHDCISVLLGGIEPHSALLKENPGTYFYSPGWVRAKRVPGPHREAYVREMYRERYADDPEMIDDLVEADADAFAHHNCAAYVDLTDNQKAENYCQDCARHLDWQFKRLEGDPSMLQDLLAENWDDARYLNVPPGHSIAMGEGSRLISRAMT
jgi:hypothetical protein